MSLNDTPLAERIHIGFFGKRNAGKSSLVNAVTGQQVSIVSDVKGTTTDPVIKTMELLPLGPVAVIDTPGFDDEGSLGEKRIDRARKILDKTDIAVIVIDNNAGMTSEDEALLGLIRERGIPVVTAYTKSDLGGPIREDGVTVSSETGEGVYRLKELIANMAGEGPAGSITGGIVGPGGLAVLVTPIDSSAPKGRLILPQQQTLREILDTGAVSVVLKESELESGLSMLKRRPDIVITDSQVFKKVSAVVPGDIPLTSFSILMARYKGFLRDAVEGVTALDRLNDGDTILISEGCTHHRQCEDIGTVKLPRWIREYTGKDIGFDTSSGGGFPDDLTKYALVLHCGGCMLREKAVLARLRSARAQGVPFTNYGITIAKMNGILKRSLKPLPEFADIIDVI